MKINVNREACCAQDDQLGPLEKTFELPDSCSLGDLVEIVMASRFLQFSSTHVAMHCRIAGEEVATVFSPYTVSRREPCFIASRDTLVRSIASADQVEFVFERRMNTNIARARLSKD